MQPGNHSFLVLMKWKTMINWRLSGLITACMKGKVKALLMQETFVVVV